MQIAQDAPPSADQIEATARGPAEAANEQQPSTLQAAQPVADVAAIRIAPRPVAEARQAMTVRLPVSMHERIRTLMFTSRRSQQDIVEDALNAFLTANQT